MDNYTVVDVIGKGSYGTVYKVKCRTSGKYFALKCHTEEAGGLSESTVRELSCLVALRGHPNVVAMHECFAYEGKIATLMTYLPYTLHDLIYNPKADSHSIPVCFVAHFSLQVASALAYMHGLNMIHRDLTPSNVLLLSELVVKVADMGLSRHAEQWMSGNVVTEPYRAPELFLTRLPCEYTCAIDMWSLGVLIVDATEGYPVFLKRKCLERVSTYQIITRTLCPKDHICAPSVTWDPKDVMPNVMKCDPIRRRVLQLLAFQAEERVLAHVLLEDAEWQQLARMSKEEMDLVKKRVVD